jgi:hypothetical protein
MTTAPHYQQQAAAAVLIGGYLPAHDEVFDLAEVIGVSFDRLRAYITTVRDAEQADLAVAELLEALTKANHPDRVGGLQ